MKVGSVLGLMLGIAISGFSHGESLNPGILYHLGASSPLAQAFYNDGALVWDPSQSNLDQTVFHGFFPSGPNEGGLLVECIVAYIPGPKSGGRGRGADVENFPGKSTFMGCNVVKKDSIDPIDAPIVTLEGLIKAQLPKK